MNVNNSYSKIILFGGADSEDAVVEVDINANSVKSIGKLRIEKDCHSSERIGNDVFVLGSSYSRAIEKYNLESNQSEVLSIEMTSNKYFYSTVLHSNKIFAIGGRLNNASIDTVEYFEPEKMKWIDGPKLLQKFETHDSVNIDEVIYAAGDFESNKFLRFDPREGKWIFLADIPNKTFHTSMSVFEQTITCTGGCDTQTLCQLYDLKNGKWDQLPNLPIPFWGARSIENKASIVIIGGYNTDKMYSYNKNNQTWSALYIRLPEANCHSSKVWI